MSLKILGIDPGSQIVGFGIIHLHGSQMVHVTHGALILGSQNREFSARLAEISQRLEVLIEIHRPQVLVIESIFLGKNTQSAFKLGHARGVIIAQGARLGCQVIEYPTRMVKKGITGTGAAEKDHVRQVLQVLLNLREIDSLDASDALAMAYYHALELQKNQLLNQMV